MTVHARFNEYIDSRIRERPYRRRRLLALIGSGDRDVVAEAWVTGTALPSASELNEIAKAIECDPVRLTLLWLIEAEPGVAARILDVALGPLLSAPGGRAALAARSAAWEDFSVGDPHDEPQPTGERPVPGAIRKRSRAWKAPQS